MPVMIELFASIIILQSTSFAQEESLRKEIRLLRREVRLMRNRLDLLDVYRDRQHDRLAVRYAIHVETTDGTDSGVYMRFYGEDGILPPQGSRFKYLDLNNPSVDDTEQNTWDSYYFGGDDVGAIQGYDVRFVRGGQNPDWAFKLWLFAKDGQEWNKIWEIEDYFNSNTGDRPSPNYIFPIDDFGHGTVPAPSRPGAPDEEEGADESKAGVQTPTKK
jgi:hypothetical protein